MSLSSNSPVTFDDVLAAAERVAPYVHRTPVLTSATLDAMTGGSLFFKCENFQKVGAFKFRGACNAVFSLSEQEAAHGVVTHSSGNHAQALALAARLRGIPAYIVMPENAASVKREAVQGYGAQITFCEPTLEAREHTAAAVIQQTGGVLVHPYDDPRIIAGQGTAALELLEQVPNLDAAMVPVGGGGLLAGTAVAVKGRSPETRVVGAEPAGADDAYRSFKEGRRIPIEHPKTVADGLLTSLGELNFAIIRELVDDIVTVGDSAIVHALRTTMERMKIVIEPSAAVPLAAILDGRFDVRGLRVGIIFSGGNVDLTRLPG